MKPLKTILLALIGICFAGSLAGNYYLTQVQQPVAAVKSDVSPVMIDRLAAEKFEKDQILGQYALNMMYHTSAKTRISNAKKQILARAIVRVTNDIFDNQEDRKAFIAVLAIESGFERAAQSPTGPKGLSQIAKKAFKEGMESCGISDFKDEDVWETDINLYAGACYFRSLLETNNRDPYIAIVAYNQGPNSDSAKKYSSSGNLDNLEALKYVAKFTYLKRVVREEKGPDVPAISDAPKSSRPSKSKSPQKENR